MNIFALPVLITFVMLLIEGGLVFHNNMKSKLNSLFALFCLSMCIWLVCYGGMYLCEDKKNALFWARNGFFGVIFIPIFSYHFVATFLKIKNKIILYFLYACALPALLIYRTEHVYKDVQRHFWGYYPLAGDYYAVFLVCFLVSFSASVFCLIHALGKDTTIYTESQRTQIKYLIAAFGIGITGSVDYIGKFPGVSIYPWGYASAFVFASLIALAIVRHQLLDIEVVIKRTAVFAGLFTFVYATFTVVTILGQELFKGFSGWNQWLSTIPTVIVITFSLRPLETLLTNATERFLFQKKFDYRDLLRTFTNEVLTVLDLQKLTEQTVAELSKIIKLESAAMLLLDKDSKVYRIAAATGVKERGIIFLESDAVITYLRQTHQPILKDKSVDEMQGHSHLKDDFKKLNALICLPISLHDDMTGVLCLGMKKSGEDYTEEDMDILMSLARTLSIAIANAQLFDQLSKTQAEAAQREKMAVIGTLAAGINHEICNPLGIVRGQCEMFLLNLRDGLYVQKTKEDILNIASDIMNKVIKETDRATGITKRLSGFAKPAKKVDVEEVFVDKEVDEVIGLIGHDLKLNNIQFSKTFASDFPIIFADRRQIQEVLFNIIRNAAQAMDKKDGRIELAGSQSNGNAIIKIADNGSGIPPDKLGQIFNPFFTTKEPGKGTGLGLFIVKQVIERNKGTITVDSQEGVGTTFILTFPAASQAKVLAV